MILSSKPDAKYDRRRSKMRAFVLLAAIPLPVLAGIGAALWSVKIGPDPHAAEFVTSVVEERHRLARRTPKLNGRGIPEPFKPFIANDARDGPNFAGAYTVVPSELANGTRTVLVISARTGTVFKAPPATSFTVRYRFDNRLLIYEPDEKKGGISTKHFEFRGERFFNVDRPPVYEHHKVDAGSTAGPNHFASRYLVRRAGYVRFWLQADVDVVIVYVRFSAESGLSLCSAELTVRPLG